MQRFWHGGKLTMIDQLIRPHLRIGSRLLIHALKQALLASETIGVQCVIVDSKPEAVAFYQRFGFIPLKRDGLKLYLPIRTIKTLEGRDD